jgi:DNA gyrase subunit B
VYEVVDNSIDEAMAGYCSEVAVTVHKDDSVTVEDDGRGIPVDLHPTEKLPGVELAMTMLHAGGKFDKNTYKVSGGLHGVGVSVVNALSEYLEVDIRREGAHYHQRYERGIKTKELEKVGKAKGSGTKVTFKPDPQIFTELVYSYEVLSNRLRELAFLNKGLKIVLVDERNGGHEEDRTGTTGASPSTWSTCGAAAERSTTRSATSRRRGPKPRSSSRSSTIRASARTPTPS